jgi:hypothetical protein
MHRTHVGSVERRERNLTLKTIERIAATLRLDPRALFAPSTWSKR